jgi:hypothetical protein
MAYFLRYQQFLKFFTISTFCEAKNVEKAETGQKISTKK